MFKSHLIDSCRYLLRPVVRLLLKHGVTWSEFAELSKDAYVAVARDDYGIQGRPTNNSRVAMLTGLSRREVSRVRNRILDDAERSPSLRGNRISQILSGWHTDPDFTDDADRPRLLSAAGSGGSLVDLLKRYAGDLPHGAIRKELEQRGLIEAMPDGRFKVLKRDYVYSTLDPEIVQRMGIALHDHAATLEHNLDAKRTMAARFEGMADNARIPRDKVKEFHALVEKRGLAFLEEVDAWLAANEIDETNTTAARTVRMGAGVYLVHDESEQGS